MSNLTKKTIVIDCCVDELAPAASFWGLALGKKVADPGRQGDARFARLQTAPGEPLIVLHKVTHPTGSQLDIPAADLEAEVRRLEALGARRAAFARNRWWMMETPTGEHFCVVKSDGESRLRSQT